jgi:predicted transcriptional regulator of viral defense system
MPAREPAGDAPRRASDPTRGQVARASGEMHVRGAVDPTRAVDARASGQMHVHRALEPTRRDDAAASGEMHGDRAVAARAAAQHGVVTRAQLRAAGLGRGAIRHRIDTGRLHRVHQGVYRVGHAAPAPLVREMAAALAYPGRALVSHQSAAAIWGLMERQLGDVHLLLSDREPGTRPGLRVHYTRQVDDSDRAVRHRIPVTSVARTLLDIAATEPPRELARGVEAAQIRRLVDDRDLEQLLARAARHPGACALRDILRQHTEPVMTRSEAERRMLALVRAAGLPPSDVNVRVCGHEVDMLWRAERLIVEIDGFEYRAQPSSAIACATRACRPPATASCASRGARSSSSRRPSWPASRRRSCGSDTVAHRPPRPTPACRPVSGSSRHRPPQPSAQSAATGAASRSIQPRTLTLARSRRRRSGPGRARVRPRGRSRA